MHSEVTATAAAAFPVLVVWAGAVDAVSRSIPNAVVATLAACFAVFAVAAGLPARDVSEHLLCAFAVLACGFVLFSISVLGAGDAKLLAGAALWFGFDKILPFIASVAFAQTHSAFILGGLHWTCGPCPTARPSPPAPLLCSRIGLRLSDSCSPSSSTGKRVPPHTKSS
jgi:Flp pilus assembly protein protease CpaA